MHIKTFDGLEPPYKEILLDLFKAEGYVELIYLDDSGNKLIRPGRLCDHYYELSYIENRFDNREAHLRSRGSHLDLKFKIYPSLDRNDTGYDQPIIKIEPERIEKAILLVNFRLSGETKSSEVVQISHVAPDTGQRTTQFGYLNNMNVRELNRNHQDITIYQCKDSFGTLMDPMEIEGEKIIDAGPLYFRGKVQLK